MESPLAMSPGDEAAPAQLPDMIAAQIRLAEERFRAFPPGHPEHDRLEMELPTMHAAHAAATVGTTAHAAAAAFSPAAPADAEPNGTGDPEALPAASQAALEELRASMTRTAESLREGMLAVRKDMKMHMYGAQIEALEAHLADRGCPEHERAEYTQQLSAYQRELVKLTTPPISFGAEAAALGPVGPRHSPEEAQAEYSRLQHALNGMGNRHASSFVVPPQSWSEHYVMTGQSETVFVLPGHLREPNQLGQGSYGDVIEAVDIHTGFKVVIKKFRHPWMMPVAAKRAFRELHMLRYIREKWTPPADPEDNLGDLAHENIIPMLDCYIPPFQYRIAGQEHLYVIMEHGEQTLEGVMQMQTVGESHAAWFGYSILRALKYMHSAGVLHRDLKPGNISCSAQCNIKILDFGLARVGTPGSEESSEGYVVTRYYRGPEIILQWKNHDVSLDIWSFGVIFAEMLIRDALNRRYQTCDAELAAIEQQLDITVAGTFPEAHAALAQQSATLQARLSALRDEHIGFHLLFKGVDRIDQLRAIAKIIGWPDEAYITQIDSDAKDWIWAEVQRMPAPRRPFVEIPEFEGVNPIALDLLERLLRWDPKERLTADEACRHPFFSDPPAETATEAVHVGGHDLHRPDDEPVLPASCTFDDSYEQMSNLSSVEWRVRCIGEIRRFRTFRRERDQGVELGQILANLQVVADPVQRVELEQAALHWQVHTPGIGGGLPEPASAPGTAAATGSPQAMSPGE